MRRAHGRLRCAAARRGRLSSSRRPACRSTIRSSCSARARGLDIVGDIELFARARGRAGGRHHRHERQEHGDHAGGAHGRTRRRARARRRQSRPACARSARRGRDRAVRARAVELPARNDAVARAQGRDRAQRHARSHGPLRDARCTTPPSKARIFARCETAVVNLDDPLVARDAARGPARADVRAARPKRTADC